MSAHNLVGRVVKLGRTSSAIRTVAVIGAGIMATAMVPRLRSAGFSLRLSNRTSAKLRTLATDGDIVCATPAEAAAQADAVVSVVFDDAASREVWFGPDGVLSLARPGTLAVECSTLSAACAQGWAQELARAGLRPVEAPVTGSKPGAESGQLVVFAGGEPADVDAARPLLAPLAQEIVHFGPAGAAARVKLLNNMFAATILSGLAECLSFAEHGGLDADQVVGVLARHGWGSKVADGAGQEMTARNYDDVLCAVRTLHKDLGYALSAATDLGLELPVGRAVTAQFARAVGAGLGELDMAAIKDIYPAPAIGEEER